MTLLIDSRVGSKDLVTHPSLSPISVLTELDSGDIAFHGNGPDDSQVWIGVELKSVSELLSSISTGRVQATQIPKMVHEFDISWLLYYGIFRPGPDTGSLQVLRARRKIKGKWRWRQATSEDIGGKGLSWTDFKVGNRSVPYGYLKSSLFTYSAEGVRCEAVLDLEEVVAWIFGYYRWWQKDWEDHRGLRTFDNSRQVSLMPGMDDGMHLRARIAKELPGIGFERAISAAGHFRSVREMVNAEEETWKEVPGIGGVVAGAVVRAVGEES